MRRLLLAVAIAFVPAARATDPPGSAPADAELQKAKQQAAFEQERLRRQFGDFQRSLLTLAQRYEKSSKAEDREKALVLRQAIDLATREGIDNQFNKLVSTLTASGITLQEINAAIGQNEQLARTLREMISILLTDSQAAKLKEEQRRLAELLKMLDAVLRAQKVERSKTEAGRLEGEQLAKGQAKVTSDTNKLAQAMGKDKKNDGKGEPKDGKKGEPKDGKGEPKDGKDGKGDPKDGKGQPKDGQPGEPKDGDKKDQPPSDEAPGREQVKDAIQNQNNAEKNLKKNERDKASGEQDEAIKKLEEVRKEIERRLKQLREEELERLLANLEARCQRMLALQIEVYEGTKRVHGAIQANEGQKASRNEDLKAGDLSGREGQIVVEANKALQLLEEDGTAVAVPQVLEQARDDMKKVQALLFKTEVGSFCQGIEEDIIAALKEIIEALKKAQQDLKDRKDQPPPPPGGKPPDQRLIDMLAEIRMLRNLQVKINKRTIDYGKQYNGEQADDGKVQDELRSLAQRQVKIEKATKDIATGRAGGGQQ
jgi:hypothetical protein